MRTFDYYSFNIAGKTAFKDAKPYLKAMLSDLEYGYERLGFSLCGTKDAVSKALTKYPALRKYYVVDDSHGMHMPTLTSFRTDWQEGNLYADPRDEADISALFSKIPRPMNLDGILVFDGICWFPDGESGALTDFQMLLHTGQSLDGDGLLPGNNLFPILSNHITLRRFYDDGTKNVFVSVCMETGKEKPEVILERLKPYLGEPIRRERRYWFPLEETRRLDALQKKHAEHLNALTRAALPASRAPELKRHLNTLLLAGDKNALMTLPTPLRHVCDQFMLDKAFRDTGFTRKKSDANWLHVYACRDEHGYRYEACAQKVSGMNMFRVWLNISGNNFAVGCGLPDDYYVTNEKEALEILRAFAAFCVKVREEYGAELAIDFGKTE